MQSSARRYLSQKQDLAFIQFNISAGERIVVLNDHLVTFGFTDLTPLFHWNTKQLFLYLEAEYENVQGVCILFSHHFLADSPLKEKNEVVVWDRIVRRKEDAFIKYAGKNKYMFRDMSSFKWVPFPSSFIFEIYLTTGIPRRRIIRLDTTSCPMLVF